MSSRSPIVPIELPKKGQIWQHAGSGKKYTIVDLGYDSDTGDVIVIYQAEDEMWTRALGNFLGYNDDRVPRFWRVVFA